MPQDSLYVNPLAGLQPIDELIIDAPVSASYRPTTAYHVLRSLPADATPAQQDSAVQAWLGEVSIRYSEMPETLHLPGHEPGKSLLEVNIPQYYRETFFSNDTMFHAEIENTPVGVIGAPIPYTIRGDNMFTGLLLLCFMVLVVSLSQARHFIVRQLRNFFFLQHNDDNISETSTELRIQLFLVALTSLLMAISCYQFTTDFVAQTFVLDNDYQLVGLFFGVFLAYFVLKYALYAMVGAVFFSSKQNMLWMKQQLFITSIQGVLLFPIVALLIYFELSFQKAVFYFVFVFILTKFLTIYKCWSIFFRQNGVFLQIFLYFCALEIVPLLGLAGGLWGLIEQLKINF